MGKIHWTRGWARGAFHVHRLLRANYRDFDHHNKKNPLDNLLFILCSVKTTESNYSQTYSLLKQKYPKFVDLLAATQSEIASVIKRGGLSKQKAKCIKGIILRLDRRFGHPTLSPLRHLSDEECESFLVSLPGVGKKVARCVMMIPLGRHVFPVDTHCWRISKRLGWINQTRNDGYCSPSEMDRLQGLIPPHLRRSMHLNMVSLGREYCTPSFPKCNECPISRMCARIGVDQSNNSPTCR